MRYKCSQCGQVTESRVEFSPTQLSVQACTACGAVGRIGRVVPSVVRWWIGIKGERHGPYAAPQIQSMLAEGRLTERSYVWGPTSTSWERLGEVPTLAALVPKAAPSAPPPLPPALPGAAAAPRTVSRSLTRGGMPSREVSVSRPMPGAPERARAPVPPLPASGPARGGAAPRLDDVRKPPPTRFGLPAVGAVPEASSPRPVEVASPRPAEVAVAPARAEPLRAGPTDTGPTAESSSPSPAASPAAQAPVAASSVVAAPEPTTAAAAPGPEVVGRVPLPLAPDGASAAPGEPEKGDDAALDDDFFGAPVAAGGDIFAGHGAAEALDFSQMLADAPEPHRARHPTKAEMLALRQEFSVVARLEKHKRKRWIYVAATAVVIAAVVTLVVIFAPREIEFSGPGTSAGAVEAYERTLYDVPVRTVAVDDEGEDEVETAEVGATQRVTRAPRTGARLKPVTKEEVAGPRVEESARMTAERFAELTRDEVGKSELKLNFDSTAASRKAAADAEAKRSAKAGELAEEVAAAFGKKRTQFGRCTDGGEERVRILFTVTTTGRVTNPEVSGTSSEVKRGCIRGILEKSIFPAGNEPLTYSQVLVL